MGTGKHTKRRNANRTAPRHERAAQDCPSQRAATPAVPPRAAKFAACASLLRCPVCASNMHLAGGSLVCERGHDFAISRKGTVNVLTRPHPSEGYDEASFENRRLVFEAGYYDHVTEGVARFFDKRPELRRIVDVGCGEGFYAKCLMNDDRTLVGLDLSKEAVGIAARGGNDICWIVGDLAALPVRDASIDAVLNVFTPAQYDEFARVLAPGGLLLKVVPGPNHLRELRHAFRDVIRREDYSNQRVVDHFQRHFQLIERTPLSKTIPTTPETLRAFVRMTPLLFGVNDAVAESRSVDAITVDAELLVGRPL